MFQFYVVSYFYRVIYSASVEVYLEVDPFPAYYFFNGLLIVLQILHIIWSYMIARIALQKVFKDKVSQNVVDHVVFRIDLTLSLLLSVDVS